MKTPTSALPVWTLAASLLCAASAALPAHAQTAPEPLLVIDSSASGSGKGHVVSAQRWMGPAFYTGATPTQISELSLALHPATPVASGLPAVDAPRCTPQGPAAPCQTRALLRLYRLDPATELPVGAAIASASLLVDGQPIDQGALTTFGPEQLGDIASATLRAFHKYALVVCAAEGERLEIMDNRGPANAYLFSGGFSGAATGYLHTLDGGDNWIKDATVTPAIRLVVTGMPGSGLPPDVMPPTATFPAPGTLPWTHWPWFVW
ncbi:hypothetical protein [Comamonas sp.]|uniref:hypothetical protein n=1 Tax=Comamonas sp. TaxID=34028 RepID=UPI00289F21D5|nr:hypothetical protein [Comamonas sp.]